ncbi:hypothetical protein NDN01_02275 [Sphingomonas sp. QA11]|uniref:hypothetical protein n=1 Tax=Sphingomonas sp. QA11 TaxID=2950605 RepID=UPI00234A5C39|nr:hypothetical protein [Sphingomonas sp. QA11]WCM27778.1 hypothetical protein NDN01_02275 [Sphingomonas sp. QA11]
MRVTKGGNFFRGSHIPGPTHNLLRMRVQPTHNGGFDVRVLPAIGGCSHGDPIDADETRGWISVGVERANDELGTSYGVVEAEVVANDSRRPEVYAELARRIVLAVHQEAGA